MDFVTGLPLDGDLNGLVVCIEKLTKLTRLLMLYDFFGIPCEIFYDRDPCFTSAFWKSLFAVLGTRLRFSSAFHP